MRPTAKLQNLKFSPIYFLLVGSPSDPFPPSYTAVLNFRPRSLSSKYFDTAFKSKPHAIEPVLASMPDEVVRKKQAALANLASRVTLQAETFSGELDTLEILLRRVVADAQRTPFEHVVGE
jgi:hypothetical protein